MSFKMSRSAYQKLIDEDIAWLMEQPRTLEHDHIVQVLRYSVDMHHPVAARAVCLGATCTCRPRADWADRNDTSREACGGGMGEPCPCLCHTITSAAEPDYTLTEPESEAYLKEIEGENE